jgi:hypothetical protein
MLNPAWIGLVPKRKAFMISPWLYQGDFFIINIGRWHMENTLLCAYRSYLKLCQSYYIIEFANGANIELRFNKSQFFHLCGLHKLRDLPKFTTPRKNSILKEIEKGQLETEHISISKFFDSGIDNVHDRIRCIQIIDQLLTVGSPVVWDFSPKRGNFRSYIKSKIIFYDDSNKYFIVTVCCAKDHKYSYYYPETMFVRTDTKYINGQMRTHIVRSSIMVRGPKEGQ